MRIRNKELKKRWNRKKQHVKALVKEAIADAKAGNKKAPAEKKAPVAKKAVAEKPKKPVAAAADKPKKAPAKKKEAAAE